MEVSGDLNAYADRLCALGFRNKMDMADILAPIKEHDLESCDLAPLRQPNEFNIMRFAEYRDADGARRRSTDLDIVFNPSVAMPVA